MELRSLEDGKWKVKRLQMIVCLNFHKSIFVTDIK